MTSVEMSEMSEMSGQNLFSLAQGLESLTGGAQSLNWQQIFPQSGNITGAVVGSSSASGTTSFIWDVSGDEWFVPNLSYFQLQCRIVKYDSSTPPAPKNPPPYASKSIVTAGTPPTVANTNSDFISYCDNFHMGMFNQIKMTVNQEPLDIIDNPIVVDTCLAYANCKKNFLKTWGSLTRIGESFTTRLVNTTTQGTQNGTSSYPSNNGTPLEVVFRPPVCLFDTKILPPGCKLKLDFTWAGSAQYCFESAFQNVTVGTAFGNYNIIIDSFTFFKATVRPSKLIQLPAFGIVELCPTTTNQYPINNAQQFRQNIPLNGTTNRLLLALQDTNTSTTNPYTPPGSSATVYPGIGYGYNSASNFSGWLSDFTNNVPWSIPIAQLWVNLPELGYSYPSQAYQPQQNTYDWYRMYSDFIHVTSNSSKGSDGSLAAGSFSIDQGIPVLAINQFVTGTTTPLLTTGTTVINGGDPNNDNALNLVITTSTVATVLTTNTITFGTSSSGSGTSLTTVTTTISNTTSNQVGSQMARFGYLGNKTIIAVPVIRPENKMVSTANINLLFGNGVSSTGITLKNVSSAILNVLMTFSMALQLTNKGNGEYQYTLVQGV
jgi:hypothetical protein